MSFLLLGVFDLSGGWSDQAVLLLSGGNIERGATALLPRKLDMMGGSDVFVKLSRGVDLTLSRGVLAAVVDILGKGKGESGS